MLPLTEMAKSEKREATEKRKKSLGWKDKERMSGRKKLIRWKTSSVLQLSKEKINTRGHESFSLEVQAFTHLS